MRSFRTLLAAVAVLALACGPAAGQAVRGTTGPDSACGENDSLSYFTPRITELDLDSGVQSGCAEALALIPDNRVGVALAPWNDLERRIDQLTLMPGASEGSQPMFIVTGDAQSVIMGARSNLGDFSIGGYVAYPHPSRASGVGDGSSHSYGLGAAYEGNDWWVGFAYRRLGQPKLAVAPSTDPLEAIELSGQYRFGSGINLHGSLGFTDRRLSGASGAEHDDNGWYIVGTVKIPF